ncbi:MAG: hypothetical protein GXP42_19155 [Chloroflexi bacterium]|nr:hypothetical protein [Chloroflexota bacterium]
MKKQATIFLLLLAAAFVISACAQAGEAQPPVEPTPMLDEAMSKDDDMGEKNMDDGMSKDDDMSEKSMDDSMSKDDDMGEKNMDDGMSKDDDMGEKSMDDGMSKDDDMGEKSMDDGMSKDDDMGEKSMDDNMSKDDDMSEKSMDDGMSKDDDMGEKSMDDNMADNMPMEKAALTLSFEGLPDLGEGWVYEGWIIVDGEPLATGVFTVDEKGMLSVTEFEVDAHALKKADAFVLTIEPSPDPDPAPSAIHIIGGDFVGDTAQLTVDHPLALGVNFDDVKVSYILGAPSSATPSADYKKGIWWPGLDLPTLPAGWIYEGWVVGPDGPISTGRFARGDMRDSDGDGPAAGPKSGPSFPGQDFIDPPIDLTTGYAAVITIEPEPDTSPAPFALKPFFDETIEDVGDHGSQEMETQTERFPTGAAQR